MKRNKEVIRMDYTERMKEIEAYYKGRCDKAISIGIDETSRHYKAFKEIKLRYEGANMTIEIMEILEKYVHEKDFERNLCGAVKLIIECLSIDDWIINEDGEEERIPKRVTISRKDTDAVNAYEKSKLALERLKKRDYNHADRDMVYQDSMQDIADIVYWMLIARDLNFRVGRWIQN